MVRIFLLKHGGEGFNLVLGNFIFFGKIFGVDSFLLIFWKGPSHKLSYFSKF
jgi:hypothetical protein